MKNLKTIITTLALYTTLLASNATLAATSLCNSDNRHIFGLIGATVAFLPSMAVGILGSDQLTTLIEIPGVSKEMFIMGGMIASTIAGTASGYGGGRCINSIFSSCNNTTQDQETDASEDEEMARDGSTPGIESMPTSSDDSARASGTSDDSFVDPRHSRAQWALPSIIHSDVQSARQ